MTSFQDAPDENIEHDKKMEFSDFLNARGWNERVQGELSNK